MSAGRMEDLLSELEYACGLKERAAKYDDDGNDISSVLSPVQEATALVRVLDDIAKAQSKIPMLRGEEPGPDAFEALAAWASEASSLDGMGGSEPAVEFSLDTAGDGSAGNGLRAVRPLGKGDTFVFVHAKYMLSEDSALACPTLGPFAKDDPVVSKFPQLLLALHLMQEATDGAASPHAAYIAALPASFGTPLFWTTRKFQELAESGSPALAQGLNILKHAARQYFYLQDKLDMFSIIHRRFSWLNFAWGLSAVATRQNAIPKLSAVSLARSKKDLAVGADTPTQLALVPVWDMCNHAGEDPAATISTFFNMEARGLECNAMRAFAPGDEITIFYGHRSNEELLLHSGFVPHYPNHWDTYRAELDIEALPGRAPAKPPTNASDADAASSAPSDPFAKLKALVLAQAGIATKCTFFFNAQELDPQMLTFVRLGCIDSKDEMSRRNVLFEGKSVSSTNDLAALAVIRQTVLDAIASKPSLARDNPDAYLASLRFPNVGRLVLGELALLNANLGFVDAAVASIEAKIEKKRAARRRKAEKQKAKKAAAAAAAAAADADTQQ